MHQRCVLRLACARSGHLTWRFRFTMFRPSDRGVGVGSCTFGASLARRGGEGPPIPDRFAFLRILTGTCPCLSSSSNARQGQDHQQVSGPKYEVLATYGHVRDLPAKDGSVRAGRRLRHELGGRRQGRASGSPTSPMPLKDADELILATDPDREGEAISWHVLDVLQQKKLPSRTSRSARRLQRHHQGRRHRGDEAPARHRRCRWSTPISPAARSTISSASRLSPVLWRKLPGSRSAGRVQSVALRLVCDREIEIERFKAARILVAVATPRYGTGESFEARLVGVDGKKIHRARRRHRRGGRRRSRAALEAGRFKVPIGREEAGQAQPLAPFTTSTPAAGGLAASSASRPTAPCRSPSALRRHRYRRRDGRSDHLYANRRRRHGAGGDRRRAQRHRQGAIGRDYLPATPRIYTTKAKNAQEAHEAIRPTDLFRHPEDVVRPRCRPGAALRADLEAHDRQPDGGRPRSSAPPSTSASSAGGRDARPARHRPGRDVRRLPRALRGRPRRRRRGRGRAASCLPLMRLATPSSTRSDRVDQHFTEPPPRYTEASLIKKMEELGIGRPSTYASTLTVLRDRDYVAAREEAR